MKMIELKIRKKASHPLENYILNAKFINLDEAINYAIYLLETDKIDSVIIDKEGFTPIILNKKYEKNQYSKT
jgi:hypothetical protein